MDPALLAALAQSFAGTGAAAAPADAGSSTAPGAQGAGLNLLVQAIGKMLADDDDDPGARAKEADLAMRRRAWKALSRMQRTTSLMARRNAFVAGALGACECWGADVSCPRCHGSGSPGTFEPVPTAFETLVVPLLRRRDGLLRERLDRERAGVSDQDAAIH